MAKKLERAKPLLESFFESSRVRAYKRQDLTHLLSSLRKERTLPDNLTFTKFLQFLFDETPLRPVRLVSEHYETAEIRYVWGTPSPYSVALSLRKGSYLSHGSAVFLHGLNDQIPKTIYVNYEQSAKPQRGTLTQEGIDRAFSNKQRRSNLIFDYEEYEIMILSGKFTGRLEVSPLSISETETVDVTRIERTLIDITVRPTYAGGVFQVLEAFKRAKDKISVNTLVATLKKLHYLYPYHQAIGFYMERAGYPESQWTKLQRLGLPFDFYLAHQLPANKKYDPKWRLYYPSGL